MTDSERSDAEAQPGQHPPARGNYREFWVSLWGKKGAKPECPFCGQDRWIGWNERVRLDNIGDRRLSREAVEVVPLTCSVCGFVRFQSVEITRTDVE